MWWKLVLKAALYIGQTEWAKRKAADLIIKVSQKAEKKINGLVKVVDN